MMLNILYVVLVTLIASACAENERERICFTDTEATIRSSSLRPGEISTTEPYTHSATLRTGNIIVYWKFNDTRITFEIHAETTGWVGIGFSPNGGMTGADIFVGWVKNGEVKVTDRHGAANTFPPLDPQQDIDVIGGAECDGWTMLKFSRQLAACEADYDREMTKSTERFIWAWNDVDPIGDDIELGHYRGTNRGTESMYFLESPESIPGLPEGPTYKTFDIRMDKFEVPAVRTYYNCKIFKIPNLGGKRHIVKYEPIIQEGHELNIHHMNTYQCDDVMQDRSELGKNVQCYTPNMQHLSTCRTTFSSWVIGAGPYQYPEDAGISFGSEGDAIYIVLEVHYDNPTLKAGMIDSSGIRFTYTETLRKHDVGIALIGTNFEAGSEIFIPPGAESFLSVGHCTSNCWGSRMRASGVESVNVFGITLHAHGTGSSLRLRQIRDGVELPFIAYDEHYDSNYQETRYLYPHVTLKSTDDIRMECMYNTENRARMTEAGLGTPEEMCIGFIAYYPKIDFGQCVSSVEKKASWKYLGIDLDSAELISGEDPGRLKSWRLPGSDHVPTKTMLDYLNEYDWSPENIKAFEKFYESQLHYEVCVPANVTETKITYFNVSKVKIPYVRSQQICEEPSRPLEQKIAATACPGSHDQTAHVDRLLLAISVLLQVGRLLS